MNMQFTTFFSVLFGAYAALVAAAPVEFVTRDVWSPRVTYPQPDTVWTRGEVRPYCCAYGGAALTAGTTRNATSPGTRPTPQSTSATARACSSGGTTESPRVRVPASCLGDDANAVLQLSSPTGSTSARDTWKSRCRGL